MTRSSVPSKGQSVADVVVIGANGFIGSHLVDAFVAAGHRVTAFDRFSDGRRAFSSDDVRVLQGDFLNRADLGAAVEGQEYVFHFLSTTTPATAENDPVVDVTTNLVPTIELLSLAARAQVRRFYFASTGGAMYGNRGKRVYSEEDHAEPLSPYGIVKLAIEHYLDYFRAKHGLQAVALRISNPYGPGQRPGRRQGFIPIALRQVLAGQPVVRLGDGTMVRDYVYVADLVAAITSMVESDPRHSVYNLGSGMGATVNEVIAAIEQVTGSQVSVLERPAPTTFVKSVVLDTSRFTQEFGPLRNTPLHEGISATWEMMRSE